MTLLLSVSVVSIAQRVTIISGNRIIIDSRGMPAETIANQPKARDTSSSNTAIASNTLNNISSTVSNKTISHYFEVMRTDLRQANWLDAVRGCRDYSSGDGDNRWRIPTTRELSLLLLLNTTMSSKGVAGFSPLNQIHWTGTEKSATESWGLTTTFPHALRFYVKTAATYWVRCVRDLTPP